MNTAEMAEVLNVTKELAESFRPVLIADVEKQALLEKEFGHKFGGMIPTVAEIHRKCVADNRLWEVDLYSSCFLAAWIVGIRTLAAVTESMKRASTVLPGFGGVIPVDMLDDLLALFSMVGLWKKAQELGVKLPDLDEGGDAEGETDLSDKGGEKG